MCGLAGGVDLADDALRSLIEAAAVRGPHGWKVKSADDAVEGIGRFNGTDLPAGRVRMAHCRFASDGHYIDPHRLQPLIHSRWAVSHNGVVPDCPTDGSDTLWMLLEAAQTTIEATIRNCLYILGGARHALVLGDLRTGEVAVSRFGLPLHVGPGPSWCSVPFPGSRALDDGELLLFPSWPA